MAGAAERHSPLLVEVPTVRVSCCRMVCLNPAHGTAEPTDPDHEYTTDLGHEITIKSSSSPKE